MKMKLFIALTCFAAVAASAAARVVLGSGVGHPELGMGVEVRAAWLAEFLGTLLLVSVVLQVGLSLSLSLSLTLSLSLSLSLTLTLILTLTLTFTQVLILTFFLTQVTQAPK